MKTCGKCGQSKPLDKFNAAKKKPDGLHPWCKACQAAYYKTNKIEKPKIKIPMFGHSYQKEKKHQEELKGAKTSNLQPLLCRPFHG